MFYRLFYSGNTLLHSLPLLPWKKYYFTTSGKYILAPSPDDPSNYCLIS
jgi:hypothetical protein